MVGALGSEAGRASGDEVGGEFGSGFKLKTLIGRLLNTGSTYPLRSKVP